MVRRLPVAPAWRRTSAKPPEVSPPARLSGNLLVRVPGIELPTNESSVAQIANFAIFFTDKASRHLTDKTMHRQNAVLWALTTTKPPNGSRNPNQPSHPARLDQDSTSTANDPVDIRPSFECRPPPGGHTRPVTRAL